MSAHHAVLPEILRLIARARENRDRVIDRNAKPDAEAVHDFRVVIRRLRSVVRAVRGIYGKKTLRPVEDDLRAWAQTTNELRNAEVLGETLADIELPEETRTHVSRWQVGRARREAGLRRRALRLLREGHIDATPSLEVVLSSLERILMGTPRHRHQARAFARETLLAAVEDIAERATHADEKAIDAMHAIRIAAKRLRYTAELFGAMFEGKVAPLEKGATKLQKRLGELHDLDEAILSMGRAWGLPVAHRRIVTQVLTTRRGEVARRSVNDLPKEIAELRKASRALET